MTPDVLKTLEDNEDFIEQVWHLADSCDLGLRKDPRGGGWLVTRPGQMLPLPAMPIDQVVDLLRQIVEGQEG